MLNKLKMFIIASFSILAVMLLMLVHDVRAQDAYSNKYMSLSIKELMHIKVTSVSKSEESLSDAAAAIYVITQEDIRRSGVTTIPEALRMAPGIHVARIDINKWAITARGFNGKYANKLLVLIDGRTVYTPLYSGVYWDVQDSMLEDIDRIEVIRGPGATLWGANAVNGVINIITKPANETQNILISGGFGNQERGFGQVRYGGTWGNISYRVYGKGFYRDSYPFGHIASEQSNGHIKNGQDGEDEWSQGKGGFRADWGITNKDKITLQGDIYAGYSGGVADYSENSYLGIFSNKANLNGGNILARWQHQFSNQEKFTIQFYYDHTRRDQFECNEKRDTFDLDLQQTLELPLRQKAIIGFGYRYSTDRTEGSQEFYLDPKNKALHWISGFIQDEIELVKNKLILTLGSKFESNDYTGFEIQPSARMLWKPARGHIFWASVSRAVRTPSRGEESLKTRAAYRQFNTSIGPVNVPTVFNAFMLGNSRLDSEKLTAYEIGYRIMPNDKISLDIAAFLNKYDELGIVSLVSRKQDIKWHGSVPAQIAITDIYSFTNSQSGRTYGLEVAATMKLRKYWTIYSTYSWMNYNLGYKSGTIPILKSPSELSPTQQFSIRSYLDLPYNIEFDTALYYSDGLDGYDIPSYTRLDLRLGWKPIPNIDASLSLQNLLDNQHPEFGGSDDGILPTEVPRSFYFKMTLTF